MKEKVPLGILQQNLDTKGFRLSPSTIMFFQGVAWSQPTPHLGCRKLQGAHVSTTGTP